MPFLRTIPFVLLLFVVSCAPKIIRRNPTWTREALKGLPELSDPPFSVEDDQDFHRAFERYEAMELADPKRSKKRVELWAEVERRVKRSLADDDHESAVETFERGLNLWHPTELRESSEIPPDLQLTVAAAQLIYDHAARHARTRHALVALAVLRSAQPDANDRYKRTLSQVDEFLGALGAAEYGYLATHTRSIAALEYAVWRFPSEWLGRRLVDMYLEQHKAVNAAFRKKSKELEFLGRYHGMPAHPFTQPVFNIMRVHALIGTLDELPNTVKPLRGKIFVQDRLLEAINAAFQKKPEAAAWAALIRVYQQEVLEEEHYEQNLRAALLLCEAAAKRFPTNSYFAENAARLAFQLESAVVSLKWSEKAFALNPKDSDTASLLANLYSARLWDAVRGERMFEALKKFDRLKQFHERAKAANTKLDAPTIADAYVTLGRGYYQLGEIPSALSMLEEALQIERSPEALEQKAMIALKQEHFEEAAALFEESAGMNRRNPLITQSERARLLRYAGEAHMGLGNRSRAKENWKKALSDWQTILAAQRVTPSQSDRKREETRNIRATAFLERARLLYYVAEKQEALRSFEGAVDANRESPIAYADAIAFLLARGHYNEALDAYHRVLGRPNIAEYYKTYSTLWMVQLAKAAGVEPDAFAYRYLKTREGSRWFHKLANYVVGKTSFDELLVAADTRGKRAESYFYAGLAMYGEGNRDQAETYMRYVIGTDMLGFYEFDMAKHFLKYGPPKVVNQ